MLLGLVLGCIVVGYLLGSLPTGYLVGKLLKGIDIREHGSGSMGATNILRTLGKGPALFVLLVDALKGAVAVLVGLGVGMPNLPAAWLGVLAGLMAVVGHSRPVWLGFRGGKSAATSLGILLALSWPAALAIFATWGTTLALSRIVSLSSILAAISAPLWMLAFGQPLPYVVFGLLGGLYVLGTHRRNLERILAGKEPQIGQKLPDHA